MAVEMFLREKRNEGVTDRTYYTYKHILRPWTRKSWRMPSNENTKNSYKSHLNAFYRWSMGRFKVTFDLYEGIKPSVRSRVLSDYELELVLGSVVDCGVVVKIGGLVDFQDFLRFAFFTGCRRGELLGLEWGDIDIVADRMKCDGKTGERFVKLNTQAKNVLKSRGGYLWGDYKKDYVSKTFKRCVTALGLDNLVFHDIRRTFGYKLILNGMPIYQVSKLLGHKSVVTTERHYAPLLVTDIDDFNFEWKNRN